MPFHRLGTPSYFGGLPAGYDYVNNALVGTPANADSAKVGGPNAGTYFIAFGENATSSDANRPAQALAQNCDFIDDTLHRDVALPLRTADVTAGSPVPSVTLTGPGIFLGLVGAQLKDLFHVTDSNDDDIEVGSVKVVVASIAGGATGGGFSTGNVTITFNLSIPAGTTYHVYYGTRTNFANFPADGLTSVRIRAATEVDYQVEELFRQLHGNGEAWNASWDSTVFDMALSGLDGRYRRSTSTPSGTFNTPGDGARITRDGVAPNVNSSLTAARAQPDEFNGGWTTHMVDQGVTRATGSVGSTGLVADGHRYGTKGQTTYAPAFAGLLSVWRRDGALLADPGTGLGYWTRVPGTATGTISTTGTPGLYKFVLDGVSESYFWKTDTGTFGNPKRTAVALGRDFITFGNGVNLYAAVITSLDTTDATGKTAFITALDGGKITSVEPGPTVVNSPVWLSTLFFQGYGAAGAKENFDTTALGTANAFHGDGVYAVIPPRVTDANTSDANYGQYYGPIAAQTPHATAGHYFGVGITEDFPVKPVLAWGAFDLTDIGSTGGRWLESGLLMQDGGVQSSASIVAKRYGHTVESIVMTGGPFINLNLDVAKRDTFEIVPGGSGFTVNGISYTGSAVVGDRFRLVFLQGLHAYNTTGASAWDPNTVFENPSDAFLQNIINAVDVYDVYVMQGPKFLTTVKRF